MKYIILLITALLLFSCNREKLDHLQAEVEQLKAQNELIRQQSDSKDRFIEDYTSTLNEVYDNLENIRKREGLIAGYSQNLESGKQAGVKEKMLSNIASIDNYIERSKNKLSVLRKQYNEAEINLKAFEETITKLTQELEQKEAYISELKTAVDTLSHEVTQVRFALQASELLLEEHQQRLNNVYYIIGSDDELEQKGVISKKGGLLGLFKTTVVAPNLDNNQFIRVSVNETESIELAVDPEDVEIVSTHHPDSYQLVTLDEGRSQLLITDPNEFWKMRYLVIVTN